MLDFVKNMSIGKKLYSGFIAVLIILIMLSVSSYVNFTNQNDAMNMNTHTYEVLLGLEDVLEGMADMETGQRGFALTGVEGSLAPFTKGKETFDNSLAKVKELTSDNPKQQELMEQIKAVHLDWYKIAQASIDKRRQVARGIGTMDDIVRDEQAAKGKEAFDAFRGLVAESSNMELVLLEQRSKEAEGRRNTTNTTIVLGTLIAAILSMIVAYAINRMISRPINEIKNAAELLATGQLDVSIDIDAQDEVGTLAKAFQRMADNTNEVLTSINASAEQVASGSRQVSESSIVLSQGATEQASAIEELTASMEEIAAQTTQNAANANDANNFALAAKSDAVQGNDRMKEMLKAMEEINESSANISKIIKVIDEIAFQTNILALNAAVEAARAGQHGKGFAVVAEEVRNLAARSASAAKETTAMIEGSIRKVEGGTRIANETAEALSKIVSGVTQVAVLVDQIATASNEQASGIAQVNQGIMQVSEVTQTNSATSEESASASEELSSQAEELKLQVNRFKLKRTQGSTYHSKDELSPDVLRMLENMSDRYGQSAYRAEAAATRSATGKPGAGKPKIALSDREFGKY
jgi:methyl-accepting chemotaxis protein